jgi:hypothetical protein
MERAFAWAVAINCIPGKVTARSARSPLSFEHPVGGFQDMTPQLWIATVLLFIVVAFLIAVVLWPRRLDEAQRTILRFLCSICAGFAGGLFVGQALFTMATSGATKITVSGTAGFALFFVVWYGFGRYLAPDAFSFSVLNGWTFEQTALGIAKSDAALVDFNDLSTAELRAPLREWQLELDSSLEALRHLRELAQPGAIRNYTVEWRRPTYLFRVAAPAGSGIAAVGGAMNICDCPNPPGGRATCEDHQLAICRVRQGVAETHCIDPPKDATGGALSNWLLGIVTGVDREPWAPLSQDDREVLEAGQYLDPRTGVFTTFRLPVARATPTPRAM